MRTTKDKPQADPPRVVKEYCALRCSNSDEDNRAWCRTKMYDLGLECSRGLLTYMNALKGDGAVGEDPGT